MTDQPPQEQQQPAPEEEQAADEPQPEPGIPEAVVWEKIGRLSLDNDLIRGRNAFLEQEVARLTAENEALKAAANGTKPEEAAQAPPPGPPVPQAQGDHRA